MRTPLFLVIVAIVTCTGCFSGTPIVEGIATLDGEPIDGAEVKLIPQTGTNGTTVGTTATAGKYRLAGPSAPAQGKHRVEVRWVRKTGRRVPLPTNPNGPDLIDEIDETLPPRYHSKSELEIDVKPGINQFDLKLNGDAKVN